MALAEQWVSVHSLRETPHPATILLCQLHWSQLQLHEGPQFGIQSTASRGWGGAFSVSRRLFFLVLREQRHSSIGLSECYGDRKSLDPMQP